MNWFFIISCCVGYLVGAIPTGFWIARIFFGIDIRQHGSGNIGATNVARVLKDKKYFFLVFLLDFSKAFLMLWGASFFSNFFHQPLSQFQLMIIATLLIIGNGWSVFLKFKGGKGVSTTAAILAFFLPFWFPFILLFFVCLMVVTKRVDVAALSTITAVTFLHFIPFFSVRIDLIPLFIFLTMWSFWRHKDNMVRIYEKQGW